MITEEMLQYETVPHSRRPYAVACLLPQDTDKHKHVHRIVDMIRRDMHGVSFITQCPQGERLSTLQQSRISIVTGEAIWESLAQGCVVFTDEPPSGFENHVHYVVCDFSNPSLLAYNLQRFLQDIRHAGQISVDGYNYALANYSDKAGVDEISQETEPSTEIALYEGYNPEFEQSATA